jgi:copper chaperone NosL
MKRPRSRIAVYGVLFTLLLAACQPRSEEPRPPEIVYGQDVCAQCGMIISEARFAAATVVVDGPAHKFDDVAEMVIYHMDHPDEDVRAWFVHDYNTEAWIRGETAFYVVSDDVHSPMGGGIAAFERQADAEAFARWHTTTVMNFDEMRAAVHMKIH